MSLYVVGIFTGTPSMYNYVRLVCVNLTANARHCDNSTKHSPHHVFVEITRIQLFLPLNISSHNMSPNVPILRFYN